MGGLPDCNSRALARSVGSGYRNVPLTQPDQIRRQAYDYPFLAIDEIILTRTELNKVFSTQEQRPEGLYGKIQPVEQNLRDDSSAHQPVKPPKGRLPG